MIFALLETGVSGICIHGFFFTVQQLGDVSDIGHIGRGTMHMMNPARIHIGTTMVSSR